MTSPRDTVGVVIRTLNEAELIGACLQALRRQRASVDLDVLVVDSGSTDSTLEVARSHGARVIEVSPAEFDYSSALNLGIERVRGEIVASLSAHAVPVGDLWLETMLAPFADPALAGASCRQVPWPDAPWQEVNRLRVHFGESGRVFSWESPDDLLFSNAASFIRRSAWQQHPFVLPAAEDVEWAQRVVAGGWKIVYEPRAEVYHSHSESARAQARRLIDVNRVRDPTSIRRRRRTARDAGVFLVRDARTILALDEPVTRKLKHLAELVRVAYYYVADFSRTGTTAEHRRAEAKRGRA